MSGIQWKEMRKATWLATRASVQGMSRQTATMCGPNYNRAFAQLQINRVQINLLAVFVAVFMWFLILGPRAAAAGLQSNQATPPSQAEVLSPAISESLRSALEQVGHSVSQIQIDHWKVSKSWKQQLQSDADSITNDLSHQLPGLLQQAQAAPTALDAQLRAMQNVNALYDVLVRLTLAADLTEKKSDAAQLGAALQHLEAARKSATAQLMSVAAQQHQQLTQLQAEVAAMQTTPNGSGVQGKTIVVDNEVRHKPVHHSTHHKKPTPSTSAKSQSTTPTADKPSPK